jgi:hypothetical protein
MFITQAIGLTLTTSVVESLMLYHLLFSVAQVRMSPEFLFFCGAIYVAFVLYNVAQDFLQHAA